MLSPPPPLGCLSSSEEWGLLRVARGGELGSLERVGEKMAHISSKMSLLDVRATEELVATAMMEAREAREGEARVQQQIRDARRLAEEAWQQSEEAREGEARAQQEALQQAVDARQQADAARQQAEEALQQSEASLQQAEAALQQAEVALQQAEVAQQHAGRG